MRKFSVLVVEDDELQRELYTLLLEMKGFAVKSVASGHEAIIELQHYHPDVLLTDISMPDMGGLELVRQIKCAAALNDVPIVVMTAYDSHYLKWAECMGADESISKPFEPDDLFCAIVKVLPELSENQGNQLSPR